MYLLALTVCSVICQSALSQTQSAPHIIDCTGEKDGLHEIGCWGYANCVNGTPEVHSCPVGMVFERHSMKCIRPGEGKTDCYLPTECAGKADGSYPDPGDKCVTYYRCQGGLNLGRFYCPDLTAFNPQLQLCDYPWNIFPPCGTKYNPNAQTTAPPAQTTATPAQTTPPPPPIVVVG
ncbi:protein obstructor-E-like isoform X2 [Aplysia californica]|nr:protein obstructor-E-like isoform X2 [Aplysia californica]